MWSMPKTFLNPTVGKKFLNKPGSVAYLAPDFLHQRKRWENWTIVSEDNTFRGMAVTGGDFVNKNDGRRNGLPAYKGACR